MKKSCSTFEEALVALAEGTPNPEVEAHVAGCAACGKKLAQLRKVFAAMPLIRASAPTSVLNMAKNLMPSLRRVRAGLLRTSFASAGARSAVADFQAVVSAEDAEVRLLYIKADQGWEVQGVANVPGYAAYANGEELAREASEGFTFQANDLSTTDFRLSSKSLSIEVPAASELIDGL